MYDFEALAEFLESLVEVDILCNAADNAATGSPECATFNKVALLLIAGKFESFSEGIVEEFIFRVNQIGMRCNEIPEELRLQHSLHKLRAVNLQEFKNRKSEFKQICLDIGLLWGSQNAFNQLKIDNKFSFGKHGEDQLVRLFERIGVQDIFSDITMSEVIDTVNGPIIIPLDFRGAFNSVCSMRNNILHEDVTPNLSKDWVRKQRQRFEDFARQVNSHLLTFLPQAPVLFETEFEI